jgi:hypothetical protein
MIPKNRQITEFRSQKLGYLNLSGFFVNCTS